MDKLAKDFKLINITNSQNNKNDHYYMAHALLAAQRSKDPCTQVGACIVNRKKSKIIGVGYNGLPRGCNDDKFPWTKEPANDPNSNKHLYVCHAEMNAITNTNGANVADCILYVTLFPCNECAKLIIQSGINEIVYLNHKHSKKQSYIASEYMFNEVGIPFRKFEYSEKSIHIDLKNNQIIKLK